MFYLIAPFPVRTGSIYVSFLHELAMKYCVEWLRSLVFHGQLKIIVGYYYDCLHSAYRVKLWDIRHYWHATVHLIAFNTTVIPLFYHHRSGHRLHYDRGPICTHPVLLLYGVPSLFYLLHQARWLLPIVPDHGFDFSK